MLYKDLFFEIDDVDVLKLIVFNFSLSFVILKLYFVWVEFLKNKFVIYFFLKFGSWCLLDLNWFVFWISLYIWFVDKCFIDNKWFIKVFFLICKF